jgi:hypothetical protein
MVFSPNVGGRTDVPDEGLKAGEVLVDRRRHPTDQIADEIRAESQDGE